MLKKIIVTMILTQLLMSQAFADTAPLKAAFDELAYSLTVEWDQKDQEFAENSLSKFQMKVAGASDEDKSAFFKTLLKGRSDAEADRFVRDLQEDNLSREEAFSRLNEVINSSYQSGASFSPTKYILIGVGAAGLVFVAGILMWELSDPQIFGEDGWK